MTREDLYKKCVDFHGHSCGGLLIGFRAALCAIERFGIGGHALEMAGGSHVCVELDTSALPYMDQVEDFASCGLIPAGTYRNRDYCACRTLVSDDADELRATLAFDAQTSGGLLLAVPAGRREEACERLKALGEPAFCVGRVTPEREDGKRLILA